MIRASKKAILTAGLAFLFFGCDLTGEKGDKSSVEKPNKEALLVASIGNDPSGFWFFDMDSLNKINSLPLDYIPSGMTFNQELQLMYWVQDNILHEYKSQKREADWTSI
jgi:hypothetical protein